jgi:hypothetical protein
VQGFRAVSAQDWEAFVLLCGAVADDDGELLQQAVRRGELPALLASAEQHRVLPLLAQRAQACHENWDPVPASLAESSTLLRTNVRRNLAIKSQALAIASSLNREGIVPIFLKGTNYLLTHLQDRLGERHQLDIDVLVAPHELESTVRSLMQDGYRIHPDFRDPGNITESSTDVERALTLRASHRHLPPLIKDGAVASLEVHRHHLPRRFHRRVALSGVLERCVDHDCLGIRHRALADADQLVHIVLGSFVHDGFMLRREFPIREGADFLSIREAAVSALDREQLRRQGGSELALFEALVDTLMIRREKTTPRTITSRTIEGSRVRFMRGARRRLESHTARTLLDQRARLAHLCLELRYSPGKLNAYLLRNWQRAALRSYR